MRRALPPHITRRMHRFLLRTCERADLVIVHEAAVASLGRRDCQALLDTLDDVTITGDRSTTADRARIARSFVLAEQRSPGLVLRALQRGVTLRLADAVLSQPESAYLIVDYDAWNGAEPVLHEDFDPPGHEWKDVRCSEEFETILGTPFRRATGRRGGIWF